MDGSTHTYAGLTAGFTVLSAMRFSPSLSDSLQISPVSLTGALCVVGAAVLGALAPDIDKKSSRISSTFPALKGVERIVGHRGVIHSPFFWAVFLFILCKVFPNDMAVCFSFLLGICTHLLLDMLNRTGIPILYPLQKRKYHLATISAESPVGKTVNRVFALLSTMACLVFAAGPWLQSLCS